MYISTRKCETHNTVELILLPKKLVRFNVLCALSYIGHHNDISHTLRISHTVILTVDWGYLIKQQQDRPILVQMGCANLSLVIGSTATMNSDYLMPKPSQHQLSRDCMLVEMWKKTIILLLVSATIQWAPPTSQL